MKQPSEENKSSLFNEDNPVVFLDVAIGSEKGMNNKVMPSYARCKHRLTVLLFFSGKSCHRIVQECRTTNCGEFSCSVYRRKRCRIEGSKTTLQGNYLSQRCALPCDHECSIPYNFPCHNSKAYKNISKPCYLKYLYVPYLSF